MTAEEALRLVEAEGLTLLRQESSRTGYKGVSWHKRPEAKPYKAQVWRGGNNLFLGYFATAEEAALAYARTPEAQAAVAAAAAPPAPRAPMTAEEALWQAEAEGLTLLRSESSSTGYKGVCFNSRRNITKPYEAQVQRDGKQVALGTFATAEEAALVVARTPEGRAAVAAAAAPPAPPPLTAEEAVEQAEAEGLTLLRSESRNSGFTGVHFDSSGNRSKPYQAKVRRGGSQVNLGHFATVEEAALAFARTPEAQAAVAAAASPAAPPAPPPMTAEDAMRLAEAEGLTLLKSKGRSTGYNLVSFDSTPNLTKPYKAHVKRGGKTATLGSFATAEEAALVVARELAAQTLAQAAAPQPPATSSRKRKVKSEEQPPDMPAGARVKLEEQPPPMPNDAVVKLE